MTTFVISFLFGTGFVAYCVYKTKQAGEKIRRDLAEYVMARDDEASQTVIDVKPIKGARLSAVETRPAPRDPRGLVA